MSFGTNFEVRHNRIVEDMKASPFIYFSSFLSFGTKFEVRHNMIVEDIPSFYEFFSVFW